MCVASALLATPCPAGSCASPEDERADGEVQATGPIVFAGWLDLPDKSREAFTDDGGFRTGDLGRLERDDAGTEWLYLAGRASARIVLSGVRDLLREAAEGSAESAGGGATWRSDCKTRSPCCRMTSAVG